jgi:hypothetical protein
MLRSPQLQFEVEVLELILYIVSVYSKDFERSLQLLVNFFNTSVNKTSVAAKVYCFPASVSNMRCSINQTSHSLDCIR